MKKILAVLLTAALLFGSAFGAFAASDVDMDMGGLDESSGAATVTLNQPYFIGENGGVAKGNDYVLATASQTGEVEAGTTVQFTLHDLNTVAYRFLGWFNSAGNCLSTEQSFALTVENSVTVTPRLATKNIIGEAAGFEGYAAGTSLLVSSAEQAPGNGKIGFGKNAGYDGAGSGATAMVLDENGFAGQFSGATLSGSRALVTNTNYRAFEYGLSVKKNTTYTLSYRWLAKSSKTKAGGVYYGINATFVNSAYNLPNANAASSGTTGMLGFAKIEGTSDAKTWNTATVTFNSGDCETAYLYICPTSDGNLSGACTFAIDDLICIEQTEPQTFTLDMKSCASLQPANFSLKSLDSISLGQTLKFKVLYAGNQKPTVKMNGVVCEPDENGFYSATVQKAKAVLSVRFAGDEILNDWDKDDNGRDLSIYNEEVYLDNIWSGDTVYQEAALFYTGRDTVQLLYPVDEMVSLRSYDLKTNYVQGVDYEITADGKIKRLEGSRIPVYTDALTTTQKPNVNAFPIKGNENGEWLTFIGDNTFPAYAISATYKHSKTFENGFQPAAPASQTEKLSTVMQKLKRGEEVNIVVYGDSISCGWSSSGLNENFDIYDTDLRLHSETRPGHYVINVAPYAPTWIEMMLAGLKKQYPNAKINLKNLALGGTASPWGAQQIERRLNLWKDGQGNQVVPDLIMIGFGVNDASGTAPAAFGQNIQTIIQKARSFTGNSNMEVLLYSPMLPNQRATTWDAETWLLPYQEQLQQIANADAKTGLVRLTDIFTEIVKSKECVDYLNTNVNHGNDFTARIYATAMLAAFGTKSVADLTGGDANQDGSVDLKDVLTLTHYALGNNPSPFNANAADVNGDGAIDLKDAAYLAQHLAGWKNRTLHYSITAALQQQGYYEPLFQKAIANEGNKALLAKALQKAKSGKNLTVVGLGGSITQGALATAAENRYGERVATWLQQQFPAVRVNYINSGIGSTTSLLGKARMAEQVLSYNPDLVLVDFTTNDQDEQRYAYSYEAVIRTLLEHKIATVAILFGAVENSKYNGGNGTCERKPNREAMHLPVLEYYNVPTVNYYGALWDYLDSNKDGKSDSADLAQWTALWGDYIHPNNAGHRLAANAVSYYLQTVLNELQTIDQTVPALPQSCLHSETAAYLGVTMYTKGNVGAKLSKAEKVHTGFYGNRDANTIFNWEPWLIEQGGYLEFTLNSLQSLTLMHIQGNAVIKEVDGQSGNNFTVAQNAAVTVTVNGTEVLKDTAISSGSALNWASGTYTGSVQGPVTVRITCTAGTYCLTSALIGE